MMLGKDISVSVLFGESQDFQTALDWARVLRDRDSGCKVDKRGKEIPI